MHYIQFVHLAPDLCQQLGGHAFQNGAPTVPQADDVEDSGVIFEDLALCEGLEESPDDEMVNFLVLRLEIVLLDVVDEDVEAFFETNLCPVEAEDGAEIVNALGFEVHAVALIFRFLNVENQPGNDFLQEFRVAGV